MTIRNDYYDPLRSLDTLRDLSSYSLLANSVMTRKAHAVFVTFSADQTEASSIVRSNHLPFSNCISEASTISNISLSKKQIIRHPTAKKTSS